MNKPSHQNPINGASTRIEPTLQSGAGDVGPAVRPEPALTIPANPIAPAAAVPALYTPAAEPVKAPLVAARGDDELMSQPVKAS